MHLGTGEILLILAIVLLLFGANKLPQLGDAFGQGIRSFRKATRDLDASSDEESERSALPSAGVTVPASSSDRSAARDGIRGR